MTRLIYLTSNRDSCLPFHTTWTARRDGRTETGRTIGEAVDKILRHSPDGRLDRLAIVVREGAALDLETKSILET